MAVGIKGIERLRSQLTGIAKEQLPFAVSKAINDTLYGAQQASKREIKDVFDLPTPAIVNSVRYDKADKRKLNARIYITDDSRGVNAAAVLYPHVFGGDRTIKASERRLRRFGFMGPDQWLTPGPGAPLDRYKNISGRNMAAILGQLRAYQEAGYNKPAVKKSRAIGTLYWIQRVGVFRRTGTNSSIPVLFFTNKKPVYEAKRFDFHYVVQNYFKKHFSANFQRAWNYAMKTARR